jgi:hypothetical protein
MLVVHRRKAPTTAKPQHMGAFRERAREDSNL